MCACEVPSGAPARCACVQRILAIDAALVWRVCNPRADAIRRRRHENAELVPPWLLLTLAALAACGGGDGGSAQAVPPPTPAASSPPTAGPALNAGTVLGLYESAGVLASLTASALVHATSDYEVWTTGPCVFGSGSLLASLDGSSATRGTLPAGSHTFAVAFSNCLVDGLVGTTLNGTASAAYTSIDLSDVTALVSASSMRGTLLALRSGLHDVTSDGSGTWRRVTTSSGSTATYTPTGGSRLVNNSTGNTAAFSGGSYSSGYALPPPPGASASVRQDFASLAVAVNGTGYILDGNLQSVYGFAGNEARHTGEVRITSNGALVARVYGDVKGVFRIEVLRALQPF